MQDVEIENPTNGQILKYNILTEKWENKNGGGGSGDVSILDDLDDVAIVSPTTN